MFGSVEDFKLGVGEVSQNFVNFYTSFLIGFMHLGISFHSDKHSNKFY